MNIIEKESIKLLLELINKSFNVDKFKEEKSNLDKINTIINILNLKIDSKIKLVGHGTNSCVYYVNNKIIKIGFFKLNKTIINNSRIIKVYFKDNIELLYNNKLIKIGIEIQNLAILNNDIIISDLYNLYRDLRDDGILWVDVKPSNIGYYNNKLVVIDTDDCYFIKNDESIFYVNDIARKFELIYNENMEVDNSE